MADEPTSQPDTPPPVPIAEPIPVQIPPVEPPPPIEQPPAPIPVEVVPTPPPEIISPSVSPPYSKGEPARTTDVIQSGGAEENMVSQRIKARAIKSQKIVKKLEAIMIYAKTHPKITNDDIEKLLHVSDATATRYLVRLVKEGKLTRSGKPKKPFYVPLAQ